jgi:hypothetical protein
METSEHLHQEFLYLRVVIDAANVHVVDNTFGVTSTNLHL